jgi:hypothetical protein
MRGLDEYACIGVLQVRAKEKSVLRCEARLARIRGADMIDCMCVLGVGLWLETSSSLMLLHFPSLAASSVYGKCCLIGPN